MTCLTLAHLASKLGIKNTCPAGKSSCPGLSDKALISPVRHQAYLTNT